LIKFLSEEGIRQLLQKQKINTYKTTIVRCIKIDEALYFVIEEKQSVELTDNGIKYLSGDTVLTFRSSRYWN
jgi:preprotein translocase subunit SecA